MKKQILCLLTSLFLLFAFICPKGGFAAEKPYFEGKVITITVGYAAGTGYDLITRLVARHAPKYIPGKPTIIIDNIPGASSMIAANQVYKAKPDGLSLLSTARGIAFLQLLNAEGVRYDVRKFQWVGSASSEASVLLVRSDLPYKTYDEFKKANATKQFFFGGGGPASINSQNTKISIDYMKLNVKLVDYRSTNEIWLAMERKELDGMWNAYNSSTQYMNRGLVRPLARTMISQKGIEHLPVNIDLTDDPMGKTMMTMMGKTGMMARIWIAPPGTPAPVMKILRDGFAQALRDPELQAEAEKASLDLDYVSDEECIKLIDYMFTQPPDVMKVLSKYVKF